MWVYRLPRSGRNGMYTRRFVDKRLEADRGKGLHWANSLLATLKSGLDVFECRVSV